MRSQLERLSLPNKTLYWAARRAARGLGLFHLALSLCWHLPLDILVVAWCFRSRGLDVRSRRFLFASLVAALAALFNVHYAAMPLVL